MQKVPDVPSSELNGPESNDQHVSAPVQKLFLLHSYSCLGKEDACIFVPAENILMRKIEHIRAQQKTIRILTI